VREGLKRFQKEINVVHYLRRIKLGAALGLVNLSTFQRELIPYFNDNVLGLKKASMKEYLRDRF